MPNDVPDDVTEIVATLRSKEAAYLAAAAKVRKAIDALLPLTDEADIAPPPPVRRQPAPAAPRNTRGSVFEKVMVLLSERPASWDASEIIREWANRGDPMTVTDPMNATHSALSRAHRKELITKVDAGRYVATKFVRDGSYISERPTLDDLAAEERKARDG